MEYKEIYNKLFVDENHPTTVIDKLVYLSKIFLNKKGYTKQDAIWEAVEMLNDMAMFDVDITKDEYQKIKSQI